MAAALISAEHGTPEWHAVRSSGIGGSDAAAVLGLSKWKTPYQVWLEKRGEAAPIEDNEPMLWGRVLEPAIRQQYAERTGRTVRILDGMLRDETHPFMLANLDGVTDDQRLVEIKTTRSAQEWGEPGTDEVPQAYLIQVQHYLSVTKLPVADVAVLIAGSDFRLYEVPADPELQGMIIEAEADFWKMVQDGIPPAPRSADDVRAIYRKAREGSIEADEGVLGRIASLKMLIDQRKAIEAQEDEAKLEIQKFMGHQDTLTYSGATLVTWKESKAPERFDAAAFKKAHPDLHRQFVKTGEPSRRFLLK